MRKILIFLVMTGIIGETLAVQCCKIDNPSSCEKYQSECPADCEKPCQGACIDAALDTSM